MLVLTRKNGETIRIGDNVEIVVTHISHGKIGLGIAAPQEVAIRRGELIERSQQTALGSVRS